MAVDLKQQVRRLTEEAFGKGNFDVFDEICDPSYTSHDPVAGDLDLNQAKASCREYKTAFPDLTPTLLGLYLDGQTVISHWRMAGTHQGPLMQIPPTGKRGSADAIVISRFRGDKLVEDFVQWDALGLLQQLGVSPAMGAGANAPTATKGTEVRPH
jgi:predicted ester cyclase